ncbi:hypothetical protein [Streptomyces gardneri]|uniref:hypothetical protein n=1 Tax=Streptomyces gardneri TaxID=66892 RepID=UPI0036CC3448
METVEVEARSVEAGTQVRHELAMVGRYRQTNAEADRLEAAAAGTSEAARVQDEARLTRWVATASNRVTLSFEWLNLKNPGAAAVYDDETRLETLLQAKEYLAVGRSQPRHTAAAADWHHARSERYALCAVATIGLLVLLTVARISPVRLRPWVASIAVAAGAVVIPVLAFSEWRV